MIDPSFDKSAIYFEQEYSRSSMASLHCRRTCEENGERDEMGP